MVDYSGVAVNTFDMTKGLFDAYSKAVNERQAREKNAQEMEQKAYDFDQRKQMADRLETGEVNANTAAAGYLRSNFPAQSVDALKFSPETWQRLQNQPAFPSQQMAPQSSAPSQVPMPPPRPFSGPLPQGNMPARFDVPPQENTMMSDLSPQRLNQVRYLKRDRAGPVFA